jgi:flagellar hook-associated protein 1 FlgK
LKYNGLTNDFTVVGAVPPVGNIPYVPGATIAFNGLEFSITGTLSGGSVGPPAIPQDQFVISNNTGGVGDNRNALLLAGLQTQRLLANGGESYSDAYGGLVADIGLKASSAQISEKAQADLLQQTTQAQQSASGVNLDEEAANLMKFQQLYQAAAQVVTVANSMFQALLNAVSRG